MLSSRGKARRARLVRAALSSIGLVVLAVIAWVPVPPASAGSGPPAIADTSPPTGTVLSPLPGSWEDSYVHIEARFVDPDGVSSGSLALALDGFPLSYDRSADPSWRSVTVGDYVYGLEEGPHTVEARAQDIFGNGPTVLSWSFSVDDTDPVVRITYPVGNPLLANASVVLSWAGSDVPSGIDHYRISVDGGVMFNVGNVTSFPFHALAPGIHFFRVMAYDRAGNYNSLSDPPIAVATAPNPPPAAPPVVNATVNATTNAAIEVTLSGPDQIPAWGLGLIVVSAVEAVAVLVLALRPRREAAPRAWRTRVRRT